MSTLVLPQEYKLYPLTHTQKTAMYANIAAYCVNVVSNTNIRYASVESEYNIEVSSPHKKSQNIKKKKLTKTVHVPDTDGKSSDLESDK